MIILPESDEKEADQRGGSVGQKLDRSTTGVIVYLTCGLRVQGFGSYRGEGDASTHSCRNRHVGAERGFGKEER